MSTDDTTASPTDRTAALPRVMWDRTPAADEPVVLVLPGGTADSTEEPRPVSFGRLRMRPFSNAVLDALPEVAVGTVAYRRKGWNGPAADTARDVRAVLDALPGASPVVLLGHSMGGRAAVACADHPRVVGVVGLAPWLPTGEPVEPVAGRTVVLAHGSLDRWVHTDLSLRWAQRAVGVPARLARFVVRPDDHTMLLRAGRWHALGVAGVRAALTHAGAGAAARAAADGAAVDPRLAAAFTDGAAGRLEVPLADLRS